MTTQDCEHPLIDGEADLFFDPADAGQVFGLACSCREAGVADEALRAFRRRTAMGGCPQEIWYSQYQVAALAELLDHPEPAVVSAYLAAFHHRPTRAEPLVALAAHYRINGGRYVLAYLFAREAIALAEPADELFVEAAVYAWRALDEYAVAAYWTGRHAQSAAAAQQLLDSPLLPRTEFARVHANLAAALAALATQPAAAAPASPAPAGFAGALPRQRGACACPDPATTS